MEFYLRPANDKLGYIPLLIDCHHLESNIVQHGFQSQDRPKSCLYKKEYSFQITLIQLSKYFHKFASYNKAKTFKPVNATISISQTSAPAQSVRDEILSRHEREREFSFDFFQVNLPRNDLNFLPLIL